jgi:hypothetical protein
VNPGLLRTTEVASRSRLCSYARLAARNIAENHSRDSRRSAARELRAVRWRGSFDRESLSEAQIDSAFDELSTVVAHEDRPGLVILRRECGARCFGCTGEHRDQRGLWRLRRRFYSVYGRPLFERSSTSSRWNWDEPEGDETVDAAEA